VTDAVSSSRHLGPLTLGFILLVVLGVLAMAVDVPRTGYGLKSDEANYVAAALSAAYDRDLSFDRNDLVRFEGLYHQGPDGIFLKRGKVMRLRIDGSFPFVHRVKRDDPNQNRLYFGKPIAYSVAAAPFVRLFGLNGFLVFHVLLLAIVSVLAYVFLSAQSSPIASATFVTAFLGASVLPVYGVFLMPEIFNLTLAMIAYFLWLYKEIVPSSRLARPWTDIAAMVLLGIGTYSKPIPIAVLVAPLVLLAWWRKRWQTGLILGAVAVAVTCLCFAFNAAVSGEFNYQGGDRKYFALRFPFETPQSTWQSFGGTTVTDLSTPSEVLTSSELPTRFANNVVYFLVGRHFGFLPYFFPAVTAMLWWLLSRARRDPWRICVFGAIVASAVLTLIYLPWTWSGGGGPLGNRYILPVYPLALFLVPPGITIAPGVLAWIVGAVFTAKALVNPFWAAKYPYLVTQKGPARRLPVELMLANELPVRLAQPLRAPIQYRTDPGVKLYFLDENAWPPEPTGVALDGSRIFSMWVSGAGRADVIVRAAWPIDHLEVEVESPIHTVVTFSAGDGSVTKTLVPKQIERFDLKTSGVRGYNADYACLLTVRSTEGFVPHLEDPNNGDYRNLSAQVRFRPVIASEGTPSPK
jgi:hypothetical protein